jgi:PAS domain S-box-containing protein
MSHIMRQRLASSLCAVSLLSFACDDDAEVIDTGEGSLSPETYTEPLYVIQLLAGMASSALLQARAFQAQRASEERYKLLVEQNVTGVFRSSRDGRILDCNDALVKYFGYASREEFMAMSTWDLYDDRSERDLLLSSLKPGAPLTNVPLHFKRKDGTPITALMNVSLLESSGGDQLLGTIVSAPSVR